MEIRLPLRHGLALGRYNLSLVLKSRLVVLLLVFGVVLVGLSMALTYLTPGTERRTFFDAAYLGLEVLAVLAPVLGSAVLQILEFDQHTIWLVLVRPPTRSAFVWGRFWGLTLASWCVLAAVSFLLVVLTASARALPDPFLLPVVAAAPIESLVIAALCCLVAFVTTSYLTAILVEFGLVILGYLSSVLPALAAKTTLVALKPVLWTVYWLLPHLSDYAVRDFARPPEAWYLALLGCYSCVYAGAALLLAAAVFSRREP